MKLLDPSGNEVSSEDFREPQEEPVDESQEETTEEKKGKPEFYSLMETYDDKIKEMVGNIFERVKLLNVELTEEQAFQIVQVLQDTAYNAVFKKLYEMGVEDVEEIIDADLQDKMEHMVDFKKNLQTYSEEDLQNVDNSNKK